MQSTKHFICFIFQSVSLPIIVIVLVTGCGKSPSIETNDTAKFEQEQARLGQEQAKKNNTQRAKKIFDKITEKYNFDRFVDTWGGGRALYLPEEAWYKLLSDKGRQILITYCKNNNLMAINVGGIKSYNVIYIDHTVWGK